MKLMWCLNQTLVNKQIVVVDKCRESHFMLTFKYKCMDRCMVFMEAYMQQNSNGNAICNSLSHYIM
jgi:hypothetical protein